MPDEPVRPDPADTVPPGERAQLAATAQRLAESNTTLAETVDALTARIKRSERRTYILASSLALDVILTVVVTVIGLQVDAASECQARQNDAFQETYKQLRGAAAQERAGQRRLFDTILNPASTPEQRRAASVAYYASLVQADQQRAGSVFPEGNCS